MSSYRKFTFAISSPDEFLVVSEQSRRMVSARWRMCTHQRLNHLVEKHFITFQRKIGLQIRQICLQLKTFEALWLQLFVPAQSHIH